MNLPPPATLRLTVTLAACSCAAAHAQQTMAKATMDISIQRNSTSKFRSNTTFPVKRDKPFSPPSGLPQQLVQNQPAKSKSLAPATTSMMAATGSGPASPSRWKSRNASRAASAEGSSQQ